MFACAIKRGAPGQSWGVSWALRADWSEQASRARAEQDVGPRQHTCAGEGEGVRTG